MQILAVGVNHRTAPLALRERVAFSTDQARTAAVGLLAQAGFTEAVVVSTCNRSELYGVAPAEAAAAKDTLESYFLNFHRVTPAEVGNHMLHAHDRDAVRHIYRVAAGLESMMLGEAEILGQVRDAYLRAVANQTTGPVLNRMFQGALEIGKRMRTETDLGTRPVSVAYAAVKLAEQIFGKLREHTALIIGAGSVGENLVEHLRDRGIARLLVCNRSADRAAELAHRFEAEVVAWEGLEGALAKPEIVISSVASEEPVLTRTLAERVMAARRNRAMFVIDLAVPQNVGPGVGELYNLYLYNLDDLTEVVENNRKARESEIPKAEALIAEHVAKFEAWQAGVQVSALLAELRKKLQSEREEFLRERRAEIRSLSPEERERFGAIAEELLDQLVKGSPRLRPRPVPLKSHEVEAVRQVLGLGREKI